MEMYLLTEMGVRNSCRRRGPAFEIAPSLVIGSRPSAGDPTCPPRSVEPYTKGSVSTEPADT